MGNRSGNNDRILPSIRASFLLIALALLARISSCGGRWGHLRGEGRNVHGHREESAPVYITRPEDRGEGVGNEISATRVREHAGPPFPRRLGNIFAKRRKKKRLRQRLRREDTKKDNKNIGENRKQESESSSRSSSSTSSNEDDKSIEQTSRIDVNKYISCIATTYAAAHDRASVKIAVPSGAKAGDLLLIVVGGSASGKARPGVPSPSSGLEEIESVGPTDVNLKAYYREIDSSNNGRKYTVSGGKNTYVTMSLFRGVDTKNPVYKFGALHNSMDGSMGDAKAPSVKTVRNGAVVAAYFYDDPHNARIRNKGSSMMASFRDRDDGMAIGVMPTDGDKSGAIYAAGTTGSRRGGGNDVTMTISLRPE